LAQASLFVRKKGKDYPQNFYDVPKTHCAFSYIAELADRGAINGYDDGSYKPSGAVTRAEWAKIMVAAAGLPLEDDTSSFNDMKNSHWANTWVNAYTVKIGVPSASTFIDLPDLAA
jgi:hypothetical protein